MASRPSLHVPRAACAAGPTTVAGGRKKAATGLPAGSAASSTVETAGHAGAASSRIAGKVGDLLNNGGGRKAAAALPIAVAPGDPAVVTGECVVDGQAASVGSSKDDKRREVAVCVPAEEVAGKSAADDGMLRGDEMEVAFGMAAHQDCDARSYPFVVLSADMLTCGRYVLPRTRQEIVWVGIQ